MAFAVLDATGPSAAGRLDDTGLPDEVFGAKIPWYVLRLINGVTGIPMMGNNILLSSCNREFLLTGRQFDIIHRIAKAIWKEHCKPRGLRPPYNLEDIVDIENAARTLWNIEQHADIAKLRVCFLRSDSCGPGFYRAVQPTAALNQYTTTIKASSSEWINKQFAQSYDVIVCSRVAKPEVVEMLMRIKSAGKILIYETDDSLEDIPDWNPAKAAYTPESYEAWRFLQKHADAIITSTIELKERLGYPEKTFVCENAISTELWPCKAHASSSDRVKVLWAGSDTHREDLEIITADIKRVIQSCQNVEFIFMGFMPIGMMNVAIGQGGKMTRMVNPQYAKRVRFVDGVETMKYPGTVSALGADIALAPLVDIPFNRCKSALKVLEAWAMGIPVIASPVAPYARVIRHGVNGLLVGDKPGQWHDAIRMLARDKEKREAMGAAGLQSLMEQHTTQTKAEVYERAILSVARNRVLRTECSEAIAVRCQQKGW